MKIFQIMLLTTAIIGCGDAPKTITSGPRANTRTEVAQYSSACLRTVKHDGHSYIVATGTHAISVIHSPACPCLLKAEQ